MQVIIMRGLPGSGKSTWVKQFVELQAFAPGVVRCSADDYHVVDGVYRFDPARAREAHDKCLHKFDNATRPLTGVAGLVIVDNTNTSCWEVAPYYRLAEARGHGVKIVRVHADFETCCLRNVHGVPRERIWAMHQNLLTERLPPWWKEEIVLPERTDHADRQTL